MLSFSRGPATKRPQLNSTGWSWPRLIDIQENHTLASSKAGPSTAAPSRRDSVIEEEKSASQISLPASVASHEQSSTQSSEDSAPPENLKDIAMGERLAMASPDQATNSVPVVDTPPRTSEGTLVPEEQKEPASISNEAVSDTAERASSISTEFPPTKAEEQSSSPAEPVLAEGGVPESASSVPTEVSPPMTKEQSPSPVSQVLAKGDEPKEASSVPHEDLSARAVEQLPPQADAPQGSFFTPSEIIVPSIFAPGLEAIISLLPPTITIEEVPDEDLHPSPAMPDAPDLPSELPDIPLPAPALPTLSDALDEGDPPEFQGVRRSKLLLRKARNGAMCKPVLQIMLGRQLADQTKPALELLAKGETVVDVAALM